VGSSAAYRDGYFVVRDGLRLHYRDYPGSGDRPPILCLHGLTRNARDFAALAERYSPNFRVLALDFRGRGDSDYDPLPARYNPVTYASDVLELLDGLGIAQAIFVGTSLGGLVMMTLAATAPQRIAAAILNDVGPELNRVGLDRIQSYVGKGEEFVSWDEAVKAIASNQSAAFPGYDSSDWLATARRHCREKDGKIVFDYDPAIANVFKAGPTPEIDLWPLFAALAQKPLLIIRGERSELLSGETLEKMKAAAPDARVAVVASVGHPPTLDEPEAVVAIDAFGLSRQIEKGRPRGAALSLE
jgi:pimeloyl-ACP methyl ester carboxylesterase